MLRPLHAIVSREANTKKSPKGCNLATQTAISSLAHCNQTARALVDPKSLRAAEQYDFRQLAKGSVGVSTKRSVRAPLKITTSLSKEAYSPARAANKREATSSTTAVFHVERGRGARGARAHLIVGDYAAPRPRGAASGREAAMRDGPRDYLTIAA